VCAHVRVCACVMLVAFTRHICKLKILHKGKNNTVLAHASLLYQ